MAEALLMRRRYRVADLEETFASGRHTSGFADLNVLERYYIPLMNGQLDDDAILAYGTHLVPGSVKYVGVWLDAVQKLIARNPHMRTRVRLRPTMSLEQAHADNKEVSVLIREFMQELSHGLRDRYPPELSVNVRLTWLVAQLDHST